MKPDRRPEIKDEWVERAITNPEYSETQSNGRIMNFHYDKETDSLYIELSSKKSFDSEEVADGVVVDYDKSGQIVGLDIESASKNFNLTSVNITGFMPKIEMQQLL